MLLVVMLMRVRLWIGVRMGGAARKGGGDGRSGSRMVTAGVKGREIG
jgi:hypothetical protein